ncbi:MAG: ShlB/FhaC/HecB family hemolysin secretion/activation protein [Gammaproteobacteria bacterium]|nr:ShlB/FhaC/HecB family hemolysin secretion/activation protein [Gammaproteobacteria bacterium]
MQKPLKNKKKENKTMFKNYYIYNENLMFKLLIITFLLCSTAIYGETIEEINAQELRNMSREINEEIKKDIKPPPFITKFRKLQPIKANKDALGKCYTINHVKIKGKGVKERFDNFENIKNQQVDSQCLTKTDIVNILASINNYYISQGYITTIASIGKQDISSGTLVIKVTDGIIGNFDIKDRKNIHEDRVFGGLKGKILNIRELEQGIEHINRVQSNNASMKILPTKKQGVSIVKITNTPAEEPVRFSTSVDNSGSENTGKIRVGTTLFIDDPTLNNDTLEISYRTSLAGGLDKQGKSIYKSINWQIPNNRSTFGFSFIQSSSHYEIAQASGVNSFSENNSTTKVLSWGYNLYRDQISRLVSTIKLTTLNPQNYHNKQLIGVSSRKKSSISHLMRYDDVIYKGAFNITIGTHAGMKKFSSYSDAENLTADSPVAQFVKNSLDVGYNRKIFDNYKLSTSLTMQYSSDILYPDQEFSIGHGTTPGFTKNSYAGNKGYHWKHKISSQFKKFGATNNITLSLAHGKVYAKNSGKDSRALGMGLSLSSNWAKGFNLSISTGKALRVPDNIKQPLFTNFSLSYKF